MAEKKKANRPALPAGITKLPDGRVQVGEGEDAITLEADFFALRRIEEATGVLLVGPMGLRQLYGSIGHLCTAVQHMGGFKSAEAATQATERAARAHGIVAVIDAVSLAIAPTLGIPTDGDDTSPEEPEADEGEA